MGKDWDSLGKSGEAAALSENTNEAVTLKNKLVTSIPSSYFDAHEKLKNTGKTALKFNGYILEAIREKLERDKAS